MKQRINKFVSEVAKKLYKFPNYKFLHIDNMYFLDLEKEEHLELSMFFDTATPYCLHELYMYGSLDFCPKIDPYMGNMNLLLNSVSKIVFIHWFIISQKYLKSIIEASHLVETLVIYWWKWEIKSDFELNN